MNPAHTDRGRIGYPLSLVLVVGWLFAMVAARLQKDLGTVLGVYAVLAGALLLTLSWRQLAPLLRPSVNGILLGVGLGGILLLGTYVVYPALAERYPLLAADVRSLYADTRLGPVSVALVVGTALVEELLWRGVLLDHLLLRLPRSLALALTTFLYALAQLGSGSWVVATLALVLGGLWGLERLFTGSLVPPMLTHVTWTLTVVATHPLESGLG